MQVDPKAAGVVFVETGVGGELFLDPGRQVVARVVAAAGADGTTRISLAGQTIDVRTDIALQVGDEIRLSVSQADATGVKLAIVTPDANLGSQAGGAGASGRGAAIVSELARAGVPVTPALAKAVGAVVEQLGGGSGGAVPRAVASLAGRDLVLSPAAAGRVTAALDLAGKLGPSLASLAARSDTVAAALPAGPPSAAALRSLLAPNLAASELAIARIVDAARAAAPAGAAPVATAPGGTNPAVIRNYVASQVATTTALDDLAAQNDPLAASQLVATRGQASTVSPALTTGRPGALANAAIDAALRGQSAATQPAQAANPGPAGPAPAAPAAANVPTTAASAQPAAPRAATATAAAATGAAAAAPTPTGTQAARAIADLATLAVRFTPAVGAGSEAATATGRGSNAADAALQAGRAGSAGTAAASSAGRAASGDAAPLVSTLQQLLASGGSASEHAALLRQLAAARPDQLVTALRMLPEQDSLQLAGKLLELLPAAADMPEHARHALQRDVHAALDRLGHALRPPDGDELSHLRSALEQVANSDPRSGVAADAARLLAASDGQQILSRSATGADPGYVYFQVPMPNGRGAEVLVRREPGRRQVTFDEFSIAFLLDTQQLGTLMIELDAHPAGIRADVRTDLPALEPFLRAKADELSEPLAREARRPVTITTGVFDQEPPASLLEPQFGAIQPGVNEFYA